MLYDWFDDTCPCGKPPGQCLDHPRARANQRPPQGDWLTWLVLAGRGFGKTRTGAEWVRDRVERGVSRRVALVAPTAADARDVMIEGESGILSVSPPSFRPVYEPSKRRLTWPNGAIATAYSADEPERLRGPQHDAAWCDEIGSWRYANAMDMLLMGLRLGTPQMTVTSTPRPTPLVKSIIESKTTVRTSGTTYDNRAHLAPQFFESVVAKYEGTRLGRQELNAELLEVLEGVWFGTFDPSHHVSESAEFDSSLTVRIAIDAGTSRHTGAVLYQARQIGQYRTRITVFADYYAVDLYSEPNALAISEALRKLCPHSGPPERVRLDPASTAKTGVGPAAFGEYQRVFGDRRTGWWPVHQVADGLDQIEILLGSESREPDLIIHPRCKHLIEAFNSYVRANQRGIWLPWPEDPQHPHEDLMDALRGGIRDTLPEGRKPQPALGRVQGRKVF